MIYTEDYERELYQAFYFKVSAAYSMASRTTRDKDDIYTLFEIDVDDILWLHEQPKIPCVYDGATWEELGAVWLEIKDNYEEYLLTKHNIKNQ